MEILKNGGTIIVREQECIGWEPPPDTHVEFISGFGRNNADLIQAIGRVCRNGPSLQDPLCSFMDDLQKNPEGGVSDLEVELLPEKETVEVEIPEKNIPPLSDEDSMLLEEAKQTYNLEAASNASIIYGSKSPEWDELSVATQTAYLNRVQKKGDCTHEDRNR